MRIDFGAWEPDRDDQGDAGMTVVRNVVPAEGRYRPLPQFERVGNGTPAADAPIAAMTAFTPGGASVLFAATPTRIYRAVDREFVVVYEGSTSSSWSFAQWGSEMLAVSYNRGLFAASIASGNFVQVTGAPSARYIRRFGDFVMLGAVNGRENAIQWSGFNDRSIWGTDPAAQADSQDLPDEYGAVTAIIHGEYPTVFQERAISRVTYVGPPQVFAIDTFPIKKGCIAPESLVQVGPAAYFIGQDGPNIWTGQAAEPIGEGRFRRWWRESVTPSQAAEARGVLDWKNSCIFWQWTGGGFVYAFRENRAAEFAPGVEFSALVDAPISEIEGDASSHPAWSDGLYSAGAFDTEGYFGAFTGAPYEATFETAEHAPAADRRALVSEIWPDTDASEVYVSLGSRDFRASDPLVYGDEVLMQANGMAPVLSDARFHRVKKRIPAGVTWTHTKGIDVTAIPTGRI